MLCVRYMTESEFDDTDINSDICAEWVPCVSSRNTTAYDHDQDYSVHTALVSPTTDIEQGSRLTSDACNMQSNVKQAATIRAARYTFCVNTCTYATTFTTLTNTKSKTPRSVDDESDDVLGTLVQRRSGDSVRVQNIRIYNQHLRTLYQNEVIRTSS